MSATKNAYVMFVVALVFGLKGKYSGIRAVKTKSITVTSFIDKSDGNSSLVDVRSFGAKGNGATDDTEAFKAAWIAACSKESTALHIPANFSFFVGPITFSGPCQSSIVFKVDGSLVAHPNPRTWPSKRLEWINFFKLRGITVMGKGVIDGQGAAWWNLSDFDYEDSHKERSKGPSVRPTSLRFYGSYNVSVQEITIQNSPQCHLKFDSCISVQVSGVTISSPENSPNTDGIHLQNSRDVEIQRSSMACGDDCVSIQTGCSGIRVHNINCGPGHGISIGGLGKDGTKACVNNVSVYDSNVSDSSYGVRIKTWQGGNGSVESVPFSNIRVSNVETPIDINQFYCDKEACPNRTSAVYITNVTYAQIGGTYTDKPLYLACSKDIPCTDLKLQNITLKPAVAYQDPFCLNSYGQSNLPSAVDCLQPGRPANDPSRTQSGQDGC